MTDDTTRTTRTDDTGGGRATPPDANDREPEPTPAAGGGWRATARRLRAPILLTGLGLLADLLSRPMTGHPAGFAVAVLGDLSAGLGLLWMAVALTVDSIRRLAGLWAEAKAIWKAELDKPVPDDDTDGPDDGHDPDPGSGKGGA